MAEANQRTNAETSERAEPLPSYLRVKPTDESLSPNLVIQQVRRLHQLDTSEDRGRFRGLVSRPNPPTIECLLIAGTDSESIEYCFGVDDEASMDAVERSFRGLFPNAYELDRTTDPVTHRSTILDGDISCAVEFLAQSNRPADWQTQLTPFTDFYEDSPSLPLASIAESMASASGPMVYQVLFQPYPEWTNKADERRLTIESGQDTIGGQISHGLFPPDPDSERTPLASDAARLTELEARDTRCSFVVNARLVACDPDDQPIVHELASAFSSVSQSTHRIEAKVVTGGDATAIRDDIRERTFHSPSYQRLRSRLPFVTPRSRGIIADANELPDFFAIDGNALSATAARALAPTPGERTAVPRPPIELLTAYRGAGLVLGRPLTHDGTPDTADLVLPPSLQPLHVAWFGKTGSGKTTSLTTGILANHAATEGADIIIDRKGDGSTTEYLKAHYATYGSLDNVIYFDCADVLPAFSFFDIRDELDAGIPRPTAVEDTVDHYTEILAQIMGQERFEQAVRSPDIIRYLVKAMFDPVSGTDAFSHRDFHQRVRQMHDRQTAPPVVDADLERMLAGVVANKARTFDEIMQGVANRIEKIPIDQRLARIFNHVPEDDDPHFDLADLLDEDVVIIFDTGGLRDDAQRVLTLVILSNLWTALRRRTQRGTQMNPLVNLYIEEAASVAVSDLLSRLLAQSRSFGCSVTLSMQFPAQLRQQNQAAYDEVLNNISTLITGNVPVDRRLAQRLATDDMNQQAVGNRLRALKRGQWLVSLPAAFDTPEPRPFLVSSPTPPPGHSNGPQPLSKPLELAFETEFELRNESTKDEFGLELTVPTGVDTGDDEDEIPKRVDTALPHTTRLPRTVEYRAGTHMLACRECNSRFDANASGMLTAIECCSSIDDTDSDDVPICALNLKLSPDERAVSDYSNAQLMFLQAVFNAQEFQYEPPAYDLINDSMIRLQEYVGVGSDEIEDLIDDGLLTHDGDRPHRLYSVTPSGRSTIGEKYRLGEHYGHGKGDLEESSQHVLGVEVTKRHLETQYQDDPSSDVVEVEVYFDLDERDSASVPMALAMGGDGDLEEAASDFDRRRLDVVGLDANGKIVVAAEVERINNDTRRAVPTDYDKMAACDPDEALWIAMSHSEGHEILTALNNPLEGEPRVEKTYSANSPISNYTIDTPGCTGMLTVEQVRDMVDEAS